MPLKYLKVSIITKGIMLFVTLLFAQKVFSQEPTITSFSPTVVGEGDSLIIIGTNFTDPAYVTLGGYPMDPWVRVVSPTKIVVRIAEGPQNGEVSVTTEGGTASLPGFGFNSYPYISDVTPYLIGEGDTVTITGRYLIPGSFISFGGVPAKSVKWISYQMMKAVVGNGVGDMTLDNGYGTTDVTYFNYRKKINLCPLSPGPTFTSTNTGSSYQWQRSTNGTNFINISNDGNHSGVNTKFLTLNNIPSSWYGYQYRCLVQNYSGGDEYILNFTNNWTGNTNTSWENINNWSCGKLPDSGTDVIINSGNITLNSNTSIRSLKISPAAHLTVASGVSLTIAH